MSRGRISLKLIMYGGTARSILLFPLVTKCRQYIVEYSVGFSLGPDKLVWG